MCVSGNAFVRQWIWEFVCPSVLLRAVRLMQRGESQLQTEQQIYSLFSARDGTGFGMVALKYSHGSSLKHDGWL